MNLISTESCLQTLASDHCNSVVYWPVLRRASEEFLRKVDKFYVYNKGKSALVVMRDELKYYALGEEWFKNFSLNQNNISEIITLRGKIVIQCASGDEHAMALTSDGDLYGWGYFYDRVSVRPEDNPLVMTSVTMVVCGYFHTAALRKDGTVWCWGFNGVGQLGLAKGKAFTQKVVKSPRMVVALQGKRVVQIGGTGFNCVALTDQSEIYVWGQFRGGQIFHPYQVPLPQDLTVVSITVGGADFVTLSPDGTARLCYFKPIDPEEDDYDDLDEDEEFLLNNSGIDNDGDENDDYDEDEDYDDKDEDSTEYYYEQSEYYKRTMWLYCDEVKYNNSYLMNYHPRFKVLAELNEPVQAVASVEWSYCFKLASGRVALYQDQVIHTEGNSMADALALNVYWVTAGLVTLPPESLHDLSSIRYFNNPSTSNTGVGFDKFMIIYLNKQVVSKRMPALLAESREEQNYKYAYNYAPMFTLLRYVHTGTVSEIVSSWACRLLKLAMQSYMEQLRDHCLHTVLTHMPDGTKMLVESRQWPRVVFYFEEDLTLANSMYILPLAEEACDEQLKRRTWKFIDRQSRLIGQQILDGLLALQ